jgi:hypothetical protein
VEQTRQRPITGFYRIRNWSFTPKVLNKFRCAVIERVHALSAKAVGRFASHTRQCGFSVECRPGDTVLVVIVDTSSLAIRIPAITEALTRAAIRALEHGGTRMTEAVIKIAIREARGEYLLEFADSQIIVRASRLEAMIRAYERAVASCDPHSTDAYLAERKLAAQLEDVLYWESEKRPLARSETGHLDRR